MTSTALVPFRPNVGLLKITLWHILAHPHQWDQTTWREKRPECGTAMCFAGWAATLAGGRWLTKPVEEPMGLFDPSFKLVVQPGDNADDVFGGGVYAKVRARRILGLTTDQAYRLFDPDNDLDDLRRIVAELCSGVKA